MNNQSTLNRVPPALRSSARFTETGRRRVCGPRLRPVPAPTWSGLGSGLCLLCVSFLLTPAHADDTLFDNYGSYVNIEHQEGLDTDRVLIINHGRVFIGDVEENGYFNAYGINGSVWGSQTGAGQVIVLQNRDFDIE